MKTYSKEYKKFHAAIKRKHGKASKCENVECTYENPKRFEWALIKGREYSSNVEDYLQLCPSCHRKYDFTEDKRKAMSDARIGMKVPSNTGINNSKSIIINQLTLEGKFIKEWASINSCAKELGIHKQGILECLKGNISQTGGFKFEKVKNS